MRLARDGGTAADPGVLPGQAIATPCCQICAIDTATGLCTGCWRSLAEIANWSAMTPCARQAIMARLGERAAISGFRPEPRP